MKFRFSVHDTLPKLAWCASISEGKNRVELLHGPWVETRTSQVFFEGAWAGAFCDADFDRVQVCMGSGGIIRQQGKSAVFVSPTHTLEALYLVEQAQEILVSNSMAFLLKRLNDELDPRYVFYLYDLNSIVEGLDRYVRSIPTRQGRRIALFYHCNLEIDDRLQIQEHAKHSPSPFHDFEAYASFLFKSAEAIGANAADGERQFPYAPIATVSSGYDSPAGAVVAKASGCREAIVYPTARGLRQDSAGQGEEYDESNGKRIAEHLGMRVREYEREAYLQLPGMPEAEFNACDISSAGVYLAPLAPVLSRRMVFSGFGGMFWRRASSDASSRLRRGITGGATEFRLRVGFIHVPVPFWGALQYDSLFRLSNSEAMRPWSLQRAYDAPIPRRIVEEAGIARTLFGQRKRAIGVSSGDSPKRVMTPAAYTDFMAFCAGIRHVRTWRDLLLVNLLHRLYWTEERLRGFVEGLARRLGRQCACRHLIPTRFKYFRGLQPLRIHWGTQHVLPRYELAASGCHPEAADAEGSQTHTT